MAHALTVSNIWFTLHTYLRTGVWGRTVTVDILVGGGCRRIFTLPPTGVYLAAIGTSGAVPVS